MINKPHQKPDNQTSANEGRRERKNALRISLTLFIALIPVNLLIVYLLNQGQNRLIYLTLGITLFLTAASGAANWFARHNRTIPGVFLLIASIVIAGPAASGILKDLGVIIGISGFAVIALTAGLTLNSRNASWGILIGAISAVAAILIDAYVEFERLEVPILQSFVPLIVAAIIIVYSILIVRKFPNYPLRTKLVLAFLLVAIITLSTMAVITNNSSRVRLIQNAGESLTAEAESRALIVGETLAKELQSLQAFGLSKTVQDRVESANTAYIGKSKTTIQAEIQNMDSEWQAASGTNPLINAVLNDNISSELKEYRNTFPENVEVFVTDKFGANVSATNRTSDYYQADEGWWQVAYNNGKGAVYIGQPAYDESSATYAAIIAMPIYAHDTTQIVGILRTTLEMSAVTSILNTAESGDTGQIYLYVAEEKQIPAEGGELIPGDPNALALPLDVPNYADSAYDGVPSLISRAAVTTVDQKTAPIIEQLGWSLVARQNRNEVLLQIREQTQTITLISIILLGAVTISAFFASQVIARPLQSLTVVTEQIMAGDLNKRAVITTQDEIGTLANSFNRMTNNLRQNLVDLEQRVAERTTDLEIARQQSENRARDLQSIGEIAKIVIGEQKLENLLPLITRLVSERFGYYHTGIFLLNETKQFAVLQAANSEGGKNMLARGHRLEVGGSGIVGYVAKVGTARIALDVGLDAVFFNNPDLPNTRSEIALPLKVRDQVVGVLDVHSERPGAFTENDANTLSILADQIAIALENARLFTQTQQALSEAQALNRQSSREGWLTFSREEASIGYHQSLKGGRKLTTPVETDEIRQAMNRGDVLVFNKDGGAQEPSIVVPIKLRGQIIGALNIKAPTQDRRWSNDEVNLAEAISERLSLALENARLIQESQRQALKEQTISEVTGKIGASINLKNVFQTAVEELGRAMPGSEVIIEFEQKNGNAE